MSEKQMKKFLDDATKTKVAEILHLATGKQKTQKGCKSHPQICIEFIA